MTKFYKFALLSAFAVASVPASASIIFSDTFSQPTLDPAWQVLAGQGSTSMPGDLHYTNQGPQSAPGGWNTTSLSLAYSFTGTNWEIDTVSTSHLNWCTSSTYSGPPNPNFGCSSGAQRSQVFVSFDPVTSGNRSALVGSNVAIFDRGIDAWYGDNSLTASYGGNSATGLLNPADTNVNNNVVGGTYWYQFIRSGGLLTMNYSYDGVHYATALTANLADPNNPFNELVLSGETYMSVGSSTDFTSVNIASVDSVPEPATWLLFFVGSSLLACRRVFARRGSR